MIELQTNGPVARLTLARPERRNAMNRRMWQDLLDHCRALHSQATNPGAVRVVVLAGAPGLFCAGADIEEMAALLGGGAGQGARAADLPALHALINDAQLALERLPLPTVALVDGACIGGGFGLAAACDLRLGTARAQFAITPARLGLVYSLEDTRRVVALVGAARARRLLLTSERLDAATALDWGVLDALVPADELEATAQRWIDGLAAQSPNALAGIKATVAHLTGHPDVGEAQVRALYEAAIRGQDLAEGTAAFLARRAPRF